MIYGDFVKMITSLLAQAMCEIDHDPVWVVMTCQQFGRHGCSKYAQLTQSAVGCIKCTHTCHESSRSMVNRAYSSKLGPLLTRSRVAKETVVGTFVWVIDLLLCRTRTIVVVRSTPQLSEVSSSIAS